MDINYENLNALFTGFNTSFTGALSVATPTYKKISTVCPSGTAREIYAWLGNTFKIREWIGDRHLQGLATHNYSIENKNFESTTEVSRNHIEDDQHGTYAMQFQLLGDDVAAFPDTLVYPLLNSGFSGLCYDGQTFFNANHPVSDGSGGTNYVSNLQAGSGTPWFLTCSRKRIKPIIYQLRREFNLVQLFNPSDPNVFFSNKFIYGVDGRCNVGYSLWQLAFGSQQDLTPANFEAAYAAMASFKNENGLPMGIIPDQLWVPPSLQAAGQRIVETQTQFVAGLLGGDNINYKKVALEMSPYLSM